MSICVDIALLEKVSRYLTQGGLKSYVIDCRRGGILSYTPDSRLCIQALQLAIYRHKPHLDVIFHSYQT